MAVTKRYGRVRRAVDAAVAADPKPEAKQEVIPAPNAPPAKTAKPINISIPQVQVTMPSVRLPANALSWVTLIVAIALWKLSLDATHGFVNDVRPDTSYWWSVGIQVMFSAVERYFFAGAKNGFTVFILVLDGFINAWGLFFDLLPRFLRSGMWTMIETGWGSDLSLSSRGMLFAAIALGIGLAYGNDKLFTMATSGR